MGDSAAEGSGNVSWFDLTVDDAETVRDFYEHVAGWKSEAVEMGDYSDFMMQTPGGDTIAGICHARGENAKMPPQWMIYITVADLGESIAACERLGGKVICPPRQVGGGQCAVIRDPAGAHAAIYQAG